MSKKNTGKKQPKTWAEVFQAERKSFPQGYCVTRIIPDKTKYCRKEKHKEKGLEE